VPWLVGLMIGGAVCAPIDCAANQWNEYQNARLHLCFRYPETYKMVSDFSNPADHQDGDIGAETPDWTWRKARLLGFIQLLQEAGGLKLNIKAYANKDALSLEKAAQRVVEQPAGLKPEAWECDIDSLRMNDRRVFRIDGYCRLRGERLRYSRHYVLVSNDIIYSLCFVNPFLPGGPVDYIGYSEREIVEIMASFRCTVCRWHGAD
jgi:hypothetical protein